MKIKIIRFSQEAKYEVKSILLLDALNEIKVNQDSTLTFRQGCRSGVCGSCAVRVNGIEKLACKTKLVDGDTVEPLKNAEVIKDLVIDLKHQDKFLKNSFAFLEEYLNENISKYDEKLINTQSNCILCQSCYSSCPMYEVNKEFIPPYVLSKVARYVNDKKEKTIHNKLIAIQRNGIWDCVLCGNCTMVCPQNIDPKADILNLQMKSIQNGFANPNINNNFGFDPNIF